jgi:hypothetical protein
MIIYFDRYVVNAARAAKSDDPNHSQRLVYVSVRVTNCPNGYRQLILLSLAVRRCRSLVVVPVYAVNYFRPRTVLS